MDPSANDLSVSDVNGHGTMVAQVAVARPRGDAGGGVAPEGNLRIFRLIPDEPILGNPFGHASVESGLKRLEEGLISSNNFDVAINFSWDGGFTWDDPAITARLVKAFHSYVDFPSGVSPSSDGLVIFAAGDDGKADPTQMAALPNQAEARSLEPNWITVAAVQTGNPGALASYSNACGIAMHYCMVAPGDVVFTGKDDASNQVTYWEVKSTQVASPQVLGAAALVKGSFPYLTSAQIKQVLLGGATDLGEVGVDPVFGHGLLNVEKSVLGPSKFDWGDFHVSVAGSFGTMWQNSISGEGGLIIDGYGSYGNLTLQGVSTYTGLTTIRDRGNLIVNNSLLSSIHIESESSLQANSGTFGGDIRNDGTLHLGNSADKPALVFQGDIRNNFAFLVGPYPNASFEGSFVQGPQGALSVYLGADPLHFKGKAELAGGLDINGLAPGYVAHDNTVVLIADGGVSGTFSVLTWRASLLLDAVFGYGTDRVWLDVKRADVASVASGFGNITAASLEAAVRVEDAFKQIDAQKERTTPAGSDVDSDFIRMAGDIQRVPTADLLQSMLLSLSGDTHARAASMTFDAIDMNRRALSSRLGMLVDRPAGHSWVQSLGGAGQGSYAGSQFEINGWIMGSDYRLGHSGVAGFAFGETRANSGLGNGMDRGRDRQAQGQFYGGWLHGNAYALGQLGFGHYDRQVERKLLLGAKLHGVNTDYAGDFLAASFETGYRFGQGPSSLVPYLGVQHSQVSSDGFYEQGAAGFGLRSNGMESSRTQAIIGARTEHDWRGLRFGGYVEWQKTLEAKGLEMEASFVGMDTWSPLTGMQPGRSGGLVGMSINSAISRNTKILFGYDQRFGPRQQARALWTQFAYAF